MQNLRGRWIRRTAVGATLTTLALLAGLLASSAALAAPDPLAPSSSVALRLKNFSGIKVKPKTLNLAITRGDLDPTTGAGRIETKGSFRAKRGGRKTKVKVTALVFGASGGPGRIDAKVGKRKTKSFGKLSGGTLTRQGFGANLNGVSAKLGSKGAKALSRALSPGSAKKASAAAGGIKAGKRLGSVTVNAVPQTVSVLPGGTLEFEASPTFGLKLINHCVSFVSPGGVEVIPPGTLIPPGDFSFPVTGGSIAPDFSAGRVTSAGGQKLTKNNGIGSPGACITSMEPPVGTFMTLTGWEPQFEIKALAALTVVPAGSLGIGAQGTFDLSAPGVTTSVNPSTREVTITGAPVLMDYIAASVLNTVFPNRSGNSANDFMAGDLLGHISLHVTTQ